MDYDLDPKYTALCNSQTIQSNEKGFFAELFSTVKGVCPTDWIDFYLKYARKDREKLELLFGNAIVSGTLLDILENVTPVYKQKNSVLSRQKRIEGEKYLHCKEFEKAILLFSQAVLKAPVKDVDTKTDAGLSLALALWARSGVFLELGNGKNALSDLECSLLNGLPAKQNGEYYVRLAKANALIGAKDKMNICLSLAERLCQNKHYVEEIRTELSQIKINSNKELSEPKLATGENKDLSSASNLIELSNSECGGNFVTAKNRIKTGNILLVEKPIASCLLSKFHGTHCLNCHNRLSAPIGCPDCAGVAFCSLKCKDIACSSFHKYECKFMDLLIGSGMSVLCFLTLKIITQFKAPQNAIENGRKLINDLCMHSNLRPAEDYFERCIMATFLLKILQKSEFFGTKLKEKGTPSNIELEVCEVILGLLQVLQFNAHEIYETQKTESHTFIGSKPIYTGVALYKTGSMFNHNCHPSVARYFVGTSIVLAATHPLEIGDVVGENYGPVFTKKNLLERQRALTSRYWFKCNCRSCNENWKTLDNLSNKARLRCPTPLCSGIHNYPDNPHQTVKCIKCKNLISLNEGVSILLQCEEMYRKGAELMDKEKVQDAIDMFVEGIDLFYTFAIPPHKNTHIAEESLRACFGDGGSVHIIKKINVENK